MLKLSAVTVCLLLSFCFFVVHAQDSAAVNQQDGQEQYAEAAIPKAAPDKNDSVVQTAPQQADQKSPGKFEKALDSAYKIFLAQALRELPENATGGKTVIKVTATITNTLTVFDTNTQQYLNADSTFTLNIKGNINNVYTRSGLVQTGKITFRGNTSGIPKKDEPKIQQEIKLKMVQ